jgi:hypothetical protein
MTAFESTLGLVLHLTNLALAVLIAGSAICRVNALNPGSHRLGWRLMYVFFGGFAASVAGYLVSNTATDEMLCVLFAGLAGVGLNILLTHRQWKFGLVPPIAEKVHKPSMASYERRSNGRRKYDDFDHPPLSTSSFGAHK